MPHVTVPEGARAVVRVDGRVVAVLGPGRHQLPRVGWPRTARTRDVRHVDVRQRVLLLVGQELATVDVPGVRVTAAFRVRVQDPVAFLDVATDPLDDVRLAAQVALRDVVARRTFEELTTQRPELAADLAEVGGPSMSLRRVVACSR